MSDLPELTRKERKELKNLIKLCNADTHHSVKLSDPNKDIENNFYWKKLISYELARLSNYDGTYSNIGEIVNYGIKVTDSGLHYFEGYHDAQIRWFLKSALIPLGVSILANTPNWWPMISGLLKWFR